MQQTYRDALMMATLRHALETMLLIHAVKLELKNSGYVIDLSWDIERLSERTLKMTSLEQFQIMRNLCLGGGAACLVVLGGLLQVTVKTGWEFNLSVWAAALSLPVWFTSSTIFETYVLIGPRSFPHFHFIKMRLTVVVLMFLAGFSLWIAVGCVVSMLNFYAALGYVVATVIMVLVLRKVDKLRAEWWFSDAGPHQGDTGNYE